MTDYIERSNLQVSPLLVDFLESDVLPGLTISADDFWSSFASIVDDLGPKNRALLKQRDVIQGKLDAWNVAHKGQSNTSDYMRRYKDFLNEIDYLVEEKPAFEISTTNVDDEVAKQAGPQLVVPTSNARFAINAANARWGSLYDALYGTDAISEDDGAHRSGAYNPVRGDKVIAYARDLLDAHFALASGSHKDAQAYQIRDGQLSVTLPNGEVSALKNPSQCVGFQGDALKPSSILLLNNELHVGIEIDPASAIGKTDKAGVSDLMMEAALSTIQDFEDSVAAVDAADKVGVYRNWLGLMKGDLSEKFEKNGKLMERTLAQDKHYTALDGSELILHGRSLLFCRNVGHLMSNPAILDQRGDEIQEGIMDAMITALIALYDIKGLGQLRNSRTGSVYIVKPKMHGPKEVAFANELFNRVEDALGLSRHTIKIGVMDEERRTTVNLKECIREVKERIVFINTGFLDRTGDEIHTSMLLGAMAPKADIKKMAWINAYEDWNIDIGLACGFSGKAQIGKGMWAMPDAMAEMLVAKIQHPQAGANTAWVPSPNGATLHAIHYHQVDVFAQQQHLAKRQRAALEDILTVPLCANPEQLSSAQIQTELDNNAQGILGYVVRWIDSGIGCSKVPDINNVGLMEDRATLRISSQHIGNWIAHNICTLEQVTATFERMAAVVDKQNANVADYTPMATNLDTSLAYQAALALAVNAKEQPNGYTEPLLHDYRLRLKAQ